MDTDETRIGRIAHGETTSRIIGAAFEVHNTLGYGFLEKVYQRAMQVELIKRGSNTELAPHKGSLQTRSRRGLLRGSSCRRLCDRRNQGG
jgi:hypothetical protein